MAVFANTISFGTSRLGTYGYFDGFLAKADSEGNISWVKQIGGILNDNITSVVVDKQGNSYVVGYFQKKAKSGSSDLETNFYYSEFFAKFNPSGNQLWIQKLDKHNQLSNCHLAIDTSGMIYLAGNFLDTLYINGKTYLSKGSTDIFLLRASNKGKIQWVKTIGGKKTETVNTIFVNNSNNIFLGGSFEDTIALEKIRIISNGKKDALLLRFDTKGNVLDINRYGGKNDEEISSITGDDNNIYAVGYFTDSTIFGTYHVKSHHNQDAFITAFNKTGMVKWFIPIGGVGNDGSNSVYLTPDNKILICGTFKINCFFKSRNQILDVDSVVSNACFNNIFIGEYDSSGTFLNKYQFNSTSEAIGRNISVNNGDLYLAGTYRKDLFVNLQNQEYSIASFGNKDIFLFRLSDKCFNFSVHINVDTSYLMDSIVYILDAGPGYQSYIWNDTLNGNEYLQVTKDGKYKVLVTNEYGCKASDSVIIHRQLLKSSVIIQLLDSLSGGKFVVYPNPTNGQVYCVLVNSSDHITSVEVFNYLGKLIENRDQIVANNYLLDLSNQTVGYYYIKIRTNKTVQSFKIIKD